MGDADGALGLGELPDHLLQKILQLGNFAAADLASLEASSYRFRAPGGLEPYRFKSMVENAAFQCCQCDPLFVRLPSVLRSRLLRRYRGNWKLVLRFLQATHQAATGVVTASGNEQVVAGIYWTFHITGDGALIGCGQSPAGLVGQAGTNVDVPGPTLISAPSLTSTGLVVKQISATYNHAALLTESGRVFTYGDNAHGCCGHGDTIMTDTTRVHSATPVESLSRISYTQVSTGRSFTAALTTNGEVYTWGLGVHGQLGSGDTEDQSRPVRVESLSRIGVVTQVAAGGTFTLAVMSNGDVYSFGNNAGHCLGYDAVELANLEPREVKFDDGDSEESTAFIISVAAGEEHCAAIDSQGQVYTWGKGYCGALGHGNEMTEGRPRIVSGLRDVIAVQVAVGRRKTFVVSDKGDLFAFGWMGVGSWRLAGVESTDKVMRPAQVITGPEQKHRVAQVTSGYYHTVALCRDGQLLPFGDNERGQLNIISDY